MTEGSPRRFGALSIIVPMHLSDAFRSGILSSTLCLKGPRSTTRSNLIFKVSTSTGTTAPLTWLEMV
eukprot:CAMPEP_0117457940 /NCGR_PEP_ID=MMETSP0784-20121206/671_1 /TAXON_ID=39447 /ORGANISM="" /LENGTH=66 /DNA_ID=CAMNT_0005251437 /DNA_START=370 /DNA_END=570 /DNA_ORIENTATION=+